MTWWYCADQTNAEKYVWIKTGRWFDARRTAWTILGSEKIWVTSPKTELTTPPKKAYLDHLVFDAHWEGSAAGQNTLRMEVDRVLVRKLVCQCCGNLLWPWDLQELGGRLVHMFQDGSQCGPVVVRKKIETRSATSLPDAVPYDDEDEPQPEQDLTELLQKSLDQLEEKKKLNGETATSG